MNWQMTLKAACGVLLLVGVTNISLKAENGSQSAAAAAQASLNLATYYCELAAQEEALAESYERLAAIYQEATPAPGLDDVSAREIKVSYQRLAETEKKAATAAAKTAAYHRRLAELVGLAPAPVVKHAKLDDSAFRR